MDIHVKEFNFPCYNTSMSMPLDFGVVPRTKNHGGINTSSIKNLSIQKESMENLSKQREDQQLNAQAGENDYHQHIKGEMQATYI
jgi:hypothetical protein